MIYIILKILAGIALLCLIPSIMIGLIWLDEHTVKYRLVEEQLSDGTIQYHIDSRFLGIWQLYWGYSNNKQEAEEAFIKASRKTRSKRVVSEG